ncbi:hypothetical protein BH790_gp59 [Gordonia phage Gsput1]|uniref:Uncharacterized protein n=1 Tax=Gordonia phage Gsput1 TaxID=1622193 RepID=A0A0E3T706_9CAUD|nr:hypothetical protein BH790_gp59 [Gordonia phage Gsput1]AKC03084.1 hypothetical protein Gsput1_59 [Gordonia phage Gsput1]
MGKHRHEPETLYRDIVYGMRVRYLVPFSDEWEAAQCPNGFGLSGRMTARHGDPLAAGAVTVVDLESRHALEVMSAEVHRELAKMLAWPNPVLDAPPKPERTHELTVYYGEFRKVSRMVNTSAITRREDAFGVVSYEFTGQFVEDDDPLTDHVYAEMQAGPNYFGPGLDNLKGITRARR